VYSAIREGIEPLMPLRNADNADGTVLSAISAKFSVLSDSREQE
jgi:hypothetical protein